MRLGFLSHHSISQWLEMQLRGQFPAARDRKSVILHATLPGPNGRAWSLADEQACRQLRGGQCPATRALGTPLPNCGPEEGLGREQGARKDLRLSTSPSPGSAAGGLRQGLAFILKNVGKETRRLPSSSLFGRVCCDWKSFWSAWLWLSRPSLCPSVKQPCVPLNRGG